MVYPVRHDNFGFQQIYKMADRSEIDMNTAFTSPQRRSQDRLQSSVDHKNYHLFNSTRQSSIRLSETQQEIYSHSLIREVMQASKLRSVEHDINRIDEKTAFYAMPGKKVENEFQFDTIPSRNKVYASQCYAKIKQIQKGLADDQDGREEYQRGKGRQIKKGGRSRPQSASGGIETNNPKVSVAGLVSYNFNSVNARKSLGFSKINHEQLLVDSIAAAKKRQNCSRQRKEKILCKTSTPRFSKHKKNRQAILKDFSTDTDTHLKQVIRKKEENTLIYNERGKKMNFIKEYMEEQRVGYEEAAYIVSQIEGSRPSRKSVQQRVRKSTDGPDEAVLLGRRMPVQRRGVEVRQFGFID